MLGWDRRGQLKLNSGDLVHGVIQTGSRPGHLQCFLLDWECGPCDAHIHTNIAGKAGKRHGNQWARVTLSDPERMERAGGKGVKLPTVPSRACDSIPLSAHLGTHRADLTGR